MICVGADKDGNPCLSLFVQTKASRTRFVGLYGTELKIAVTAPPIDGRANKAVQSYIVKFFSLPKSAVKIIKGQQSRHKRILLLGLDFPTVVEKLEAVL